MSYSIQFNQEAFNGGELSPLMNARVSSEQYKSGCSKMENFIPRVQGGAFKRPGLQFVGTSKGGLYSEARLHGFKRSTQVNYMLEFGSGYIRFWVGGTSPALLEVDIGDVTAWNGSASAGLWATSTAYSVGNQITSNGIVYRCIVAHTSGASDEPGVGDDWSLKWIEIPFYEVGDLVTDSGVIYYCNTNHYPSTTFAADSAYWSAFTDEIYEVPTPYQSDELFQLQFTQLNDVLFIAHPNHHPKRLSRISETRWNFEDVPWEFAPSLDVNEDSISVAVNFDGVPEFGWPWVTATPYEVGDRVHGISVPYRGLVYECINKHTSSAGGAGGDEPGIGATFATQWSLISTGYLKGDRVTASDAYPAGTVNPNNGEIFTCHTAYNPYTVNNDEPGLGSAWRDYWNFGTSSIKTASWVAGTSYVVNNRVRGGGGQIYRCRGNHKAIAPKSSSGKNPGVQGNMPGVSKSWTVYWQRVGSDSDLAGLSFNLTSSSDLFETTDVGTTWLLEIGTPGIQAQVATPAAGSSISNADAPLFIQGDYRVSSRYNTGGAMIGTITVEESLDNQQWSPIKQFLFTAVDEGNIDWTGTAPPTGAWYRITVKKDTGGGVSTRAVTLEASSSIYKLPFKVESYVSATKVKGSIVMPVGQLPPALAIGISTPIYRKPAFSPTAGYPRTVAFHDSRLWWGGTVTEPTRMWASHTEDYYIYLGGSLDTDGLDLTLAAIESNAIQWMASFNRSLVVGTTGDEWTVDAGETDEAITPTKIRARRRTRYGSNGIPPQLTGDSLLWIQRGGNKLREFSYIFQKDGFEAPDMTVVAEHIIGNGFTQIAYQAAPEPILWAVDGISFYSFIYSREHNVVAWSRHSDFYLSPMKSVSVMYGDDFEEVWFYNESGAILRLHPETQNEYFGPTSPFSVQPDKSCFVDFSKYATGTWNGTHTVFSGFTYLSNLIGSVNPVSIFCGNGDLKNGVFDGDNVKIAENLANKNAWLGVAVTADLRTMPMHAFSQTGSSFMKSHRVVRVDIRVAKSIGGQFYDVPRSGETPEYLDIAFDSFNDQLGSLGFSGIAGIQTMNSSHKRQVEIGIISSDPAPFNLLAIGATLEISGD